MEFHVEQPELRGIGLAHELGRVYARARRKGAFGKILFFLGLVTLVLGIMALVGTVLNAAELAEEIESTPAVIAVGLIMNLLMILLGLSWTGLDGAAYSTAGRCCWACAGARVTRGFIQIALRMWTRACVSAASTPRSRLCLKAGGHFTSNWRPSGFWF